MSVVVVATSKPKPGRLQDALDAFEAVVSMVYEEPGCEFYAVHTDGENLVMVERWESREALQAHGEGEALKKLAELRGDAMEGPTTIYVLDAVAFDGHPKGVIPA